jgi:hypothetical protein
MQSTHVPDQDISNQCTIPIVWQKHKYLGADTTTHQQTIKISNGEIIRTIYHRAKKQLNLDYTEMKESKLFAVRGGGERLSIADVCITDGTNACVLVEGSHSLATNPHHVLFSAIVFVYE